MFCNKFKSKHEHFIRVLCILRSVNIKTNSEETAINAQITNNACNKHFVNLVSSFSLTSVGKTEEVYSNVRMVSLSRYN